MTTINTPSLVSRGAEPTPAAPRRFLPARSAAWRFLGLAAAAVAIGCDPPPPPPAPPPLSTEELATQKYGRLVKEVRRRIDALQASTRGGAGGPLINLTAKIKVTDELLPPAADGLLWRGRITVATQSSVTVITPPGEEDLSAARQPKRPGEEDLGVETGDPDLDSALKGLVGPPPSPPAGPAMHVLDNDNTEVYELIFENDRWRLVTPIDEESEMGLIFRIAIKSQ